MEGRFVKDCKSCKAIQGIISLTNAPRILDATHWIVEHAYPTSVKGWLVMVLKRHCRAMHELTTEEIAEFNQLMPLLCQALHEILSTEREYVVQFSESTNHVHFNIIARLPDWPDSMKGPQVFSALGEHIQNPLSSEVITPLALEIIEYLRAQLGWDV